MKEGINFLLDSLKKMYGKEMVEISENTYELKGLSTLVITESGALVTDKITGTEIQVDISSLEDEERKDRELYRVIYAGIGTPREDRIYFKSLHNEVERFRTIRDKTGLPVLTGQRRCSILVSNRGSEHPYKDLTEMPISVLRFLETNTNENLKGFELYENGELVYGPTGPLWKDGMNPLGTIIELSYELVRNAGWIKVVENERKK